MGKIMENRAGMRGMDRALFGIVSSITVAMLVWVGTTLNSNQIELTKLQVSVGELYNDAKEASFNNRDVILRVRQLEQQVSVLQNMAGV